MSPGVDSGGRPGGKSPQRGSGRIALQDTTREKTGIVVCEIPGCLSGARYARLFSVGRGLDSLCTFAQRENSSSIKRPASPLSATKIESQFQSERLRLNRGAHSLRSVSFKWNDVLYHAAQTRDANLAGTKARAA